MKTYVLYHDCCYDGWGSAFVAWLRLKDTTVSFLPVNYKKPCPISDNDLKGSSVYIVDFSFPKEETLRISSLAKSLIVLDHHVTSKEDLAGIPFAYFDMNKSGAMLSWNYFHENEPAPKIIQYIQDRDLWKFQLPFSKEISAVIQSTKIGDVNFFNQFYELMLRIENDFDSVASEGSGILRSIDNSVELIISRSLEFREIDGFSVPVINSSAFESEIGNKLLDKFPDSPFSACYYIQNESTQKWSLRSRGSFDVSAIAKKYGGGGHKNASGFIVKK